MNVNKAVMTTDGSSIRFSVPFSKVNKENRTVSGFATLNNVDQQSDLVTAEASAAAFSRFRGNLREMHAPIAVGKVLSFQEQDYYDPKTDQTYKGVWVNAYVSKGAQDTWEKVLDGTLTGFSIGGDILDEESRFDKAYNRQVRIVKDYQLLELSLVDSPANQLANVFSIVKMNDGTSVVKGMAVDVKVENIFWCNKDQIASTTPDDSLECASCGEKMENIGWVESNSSDKLEKVKSAIGRVKNSPAIETSNTTVTVNIDGVVDAKAIAKQVRDAMMNKTLKGGVDVAEETVEETQEVPEVAADNEEVVSTTEEKPADEPTAEAVEEVVAEEVNIKELLNNFAAELKDAFASSKEEASKAVDAVKEEVAELAKSLGEKISGLEEKFGTLEAGVESVAKRVDSVESDTSVKKSLDLGRQEDKAEKRKSLWSGAFLGTDEIVN